MSKNIGIAGCSGRVGKLIVKELYEGNFPELSLSAGLVSSQSPGKAKDLGEIAGLIKMDILSTDKTEDFFAQSDIVIDFSFPDMTMKNVEAARKDKTPIIIGTTGLNSEQEAFLKDASKETTIVYAANMSVGVNVLLALIEKTAQILDEEWDIEIAETHHKHKVDAPSGTAIAAGIAAAKGRNVKDLESVADYARHGQTGARKKGQIGFSVLRGGDVVGEHTVSFFGEGERIELGHIATNRALFAKGALKAAIWAQNQKPGLYNMQDVLNIKL